MRFISTGWHKPGLQARRKSMAKEILCGFGIDVDAVSGWLGPYGGEEESVCLADLTSIE